MTKKPTPASIRGFGAVFGIIFLLALLPPIYIAFSSGRQVVAGLPSSMWYLILVSAAGIGAVVALYVSEAKNGVLD